MKCLHRYDWVVVLDVDEVIVPRKEASWAEMMERVGSSCAQTILTSSDPHLKLTQSYHNVMKVGLEAPKGILQLVLN